MIKRINETKTFTLFLTMLRCPKNINILKLYETDLLIEFYLNLWSKSAGYDVIDLVSNLSQDDSYKARNNIKLQMTNNLGNIEVAKWG